MNIFKEKQDISNKKKAKSKECARELPILRTVFHLLILFLLLPYCFDEVSWFASIYFYLLIYVLNAL